MARRTLLTGTIVLAALIAVLLGAGTSLLASVQGGFSEVKGAVNLPNPDFREAVVKVLRYVVSFLALAGVIAIVVAGIMMVVGGGSDTSVQRAKKIIIYTLVGILVVFFARVIVGFFQDLPV